MLSTMFTYLLLYYMYMQWFSLLCCWSNENHYHGFIKVMDHFSGLLTKTVCAGLSHLSHSQLHVHSMYLLKLLCMLKLKLLDYVKLSFMTVQKMIIKFNTDDKL